jgi:hypothetical protein
VCYLDAADAERPVGFNPATRIARERRALAAAAIVAAFKHLWSHSWGTVSWRFCLGDTRASSICRASTPTMFFGTDFCAP